MGFRVFYFCESTGEERDASDAVAVDRDTAIGMAQRLLRGPTDFFGVIDEADVTVQFAPQSDGRVWMEIPEPSRQGSYGRHVAAAELPAVLTKLTAPIDRSLLGPLEFQTWG